MRLHNIHDLADGRGKRPRGAEHRVDVLNSRSKALGVQKPAKSGAYPRFKKHLRRKRTWRDVGNLLQQPGRTRHLQKDFSSRFVTLSIPYFVENLASASPETNLPEGGRGSLQATGCHLHLNVTRGRRKTVTKSIRLLYPRACRRNLDWANGRVATNASLIGSPVRRKYTWRRSPDLWRLHDRKSCGDEVLAGG